MVHFQWPFLFPKNVERFLRDFGKTVWGRNFDLGKTLKLFQRAAGLERGG